MAYLELVRCRLAIQCCIGYFPDGRERHRTFSLQDVRPDASTDALASVVRAIAPLLAYPITKVRIVKKYVLVLDGADAAALFSSPGGSGVQSIGAKTTPNSKAIPTRFAGAPFKGGLFQRRSGRTLVNCPAAPFYSVRFRCRLAYRVRRRLAGATARAKIIAPAAPKMPNTPKPASHPPPLSLSNWLLLPS